MALSMAMSQAATETRAKENSLELRYLGGIAFVFGATELLRI